MKRAILFGAIFVGGLGILLSIIVWYSTMPYQPTGGWSWNQEMGGMWDGMMGNNYYISNYALQYLRVAVLASIALVALGTAGILYYLAYPQIPLNRTAVVSSFSPPMLTESPTGSIASSQFVSPTSISAQEYENVSPKRTETFQLNASSVEKGTEHDEGGRPTVTKGSWSLLMRTSKPDEQKVLEVLARHNGKYLQKYIAKESGLSRLRTHRIVARFAERGIVTAVKSGNTNEVCLASFVSGDS